MPDASGNVGQGSVPRQASLKGQASQGQAGAAEPSPRRLSTHQKAVLIQVLLGFPDEPVSVLYSPSASDGFNYAEDFSTIFKPINWTVVGPEPAENLAYSSSGLAIVMRREKLPPSAEALRDALRIYGIEAQVTREQPNLCEAENFALMVTKP
jgi:hypothetical protein